MILTIISYPRVCVSVCYLWGPASWWKTRCWQAGCEASDRRYRSGSSAGLQKERTQVVRIMSVCVWFCRPKKRSHDRDTALVSANVKTAKPMDAQWWNEIIDKHLSELCVSPQDHVLPYYLFYTKFRIFIFYNNPLRQIQAEKYMTTCQNSKFWSSIWFLCINEPIKAWKSLWWAVNHICDANNRRRDLKST